MSLSPFQKLYDRLFKNKHDALAVLVIGCGDNEAFHRRLVDWFPNARITALDIRHVTVPDFLYMDARLPGVGRMLPDAMYDVIIDDVRDADFAIFNNMIPHLRTKGIYCMQYLNEKENPSSIKDVAQAHGFSATVYDYQPMHNDTIAIIL